MDTLLPRDTTRVVGVTVDGDAPPVTGRQDRHCQRLLFNLSRRQFKVPRLT